MTDMKYLADALAYHTKGRKAVLEQTELEEKKCSCCDANPCRCEKSVSEGQDLKNDKNGNGIDDKDESEAKDNVVKKTNAKADKKMSEESEIEEADKGSWMKDSGWKKPKDGPTKDQFGNEIKDKNRAKSLSKDATKTSAKMTKEEVEDELLEHALDLHEMIQDLNVLFIEQELSLTEAFQAAAMTDEELEENFGKMTKTKRLIAAKKAALTKRKTGNWGGRKGVNAPPRQPKPLKRMRQPA